jgi:hypothetical protein
MEHTMVLFVDDIKLNEEQDAILSLVSSDAMTEAESILHDSLPIPVKITKLLGAIMTILEQTQYNRAIISGKTKKVVALELTKRLIQYVAGDTPELGQMIQVSQTMGPAFLETLITVSKGVNISVVEKRVETCCFGFFSK